MEEGEGALMNEAFALLEKANRLEETADKQRVPWVQRREAATKYFEACYLLKRCIERMPIVVDWKSSSSSSDMQKARSLLEEKISHYDGLAWSLLRNVEQEEAKAAQMTKGGRGGRRPNGGGRGGFGDSRREKSIRSWQISQRDGSDASSAFQRVVPAARSTPMSLNNSVLMGKTARANALLATAIDYDESGKSEEAIAEYTSAVELFLDAMKIAETDDMATHTSKGSSSSSMSAQVMLRRRIEGALDRIETLKGGSSPPKTPKPRGGGAKVTPKRGFFSGSSSPPQSQPSSSTTSPSTSSLTREEIDVLKRSSLIASGLFMPWSDEEAQKLSASSKSLYKDPDGLLKLSDKQQSHLFKFARPDEIASMRKSFHYLPSPPPVVMVRSLTPYTIRQRLVTDCSFIASLCICAAYERRFLSNNHHGSGLVTSIIYPQDANGSPLYNPSGKYMVKLWLNGVARRVLVDDLFPVDSSGNLLCSHTDTDDHAVELWVAIIEKAYMKLCGGYDFPGSNSGVDLFALTGWIPERIFFPEDPNNVRDFETSSERAWERLYSATSFGDCLVTASSSPDITGKRAEEVGLITGHAYAVLSVVKTSHGLRMLQMKNPWAHKGWKGRYSCYDVDSWQDDAVLRSEINYNVRKAQKCDDGVFWICWEDVLVYFRNIQLSWNPALFPNRKTTHGFWPVALGPKDDSFNCRDNPQFVLEMSQAAVKQKASVWLLLSRHVTRQDQEGNQVTDYLTLHIHRNGAEKERIRYPGGRRCVLTGAYTNNSHVLVRYDIQGPEDEYLSLVLSQYQKSNDLGYTLSCYCTHAFQLFRPKKDLLHKQVLTSSWTESTSGGPIGHDHYSTNPQWSLTVPRGGSKLQVMCAAVKTFAINVVLVKVTDKGNRIHKIYGEPALDTGDYRHGFACTTQSGMVEAGDYTLVASTFNPGQCGDFTLTVMSSVQVDIIPIAHAI